LNEHSEIKMVDPFREGVTMKPCSKVGGKISETVTHGFSNKVQDGLLRHSLNGEWCNLVVGTNNSNLMRNYSTNIIWYFNSKKFMNIGLQFYGLTMGDHIKFSIASQFNTGTIGIGVNILGYGVQKN